MTPKPDTRVEDERLARLAREWFADARQRDPEQTPAQRPTKRGDGGDGGSANSGGFFDWSSGDGGDCGD